jgi:hypothetical protein
VVKISIDARSMSSQEMTSASEIGQYRRLCAAIVCISLAMFTLRMPGVGKQAELSDRGSSKGFLSNVK